MQDPKDLLERAAELTRKAESESSPEVRDRLKVMAVHYTHLAESEQWLVENPVSAAGIGGLFKS